MQTFALTLDDGRSIPIKVSGSLTMRRATAKPAPRPVRPRPAPRFRPMAAATLERLEDVVYPVYAQPKFDGVRCLIVEGLGPVTRTLKPIPNDHIRAALADAPVGLDGELVTYSGGPDPFNRVQSKVMTRAGAPTFTFHVFDRFDDPLEPFAERRPTEAPHPRVSLAPTRLVTSRGELERLERLWVDVMGHEGVVLRDPDGEYVLGPAGDGELVKWKRFEDAEAIVIGVRPLVKGGQAQPAVGALVLEQPNGVAFRLGVGFSAAERATLWARKETLTGAAVTYRFQGRGRNGRPLRARYAGVRFD
jgi:DNA ligase-1